ncbi:pseudouridine synthase [Umboniibacter marinipuniceus]|uniref:Dual-specificity RNA pseudouridine synthase RluA n=1 Tax=Umboniibacter marinipuniceus TaxID=569599 RepID=A0A3M0A4N1_9GAMM|nr:pseudouridine synthase [Umboniibacter marinipuniceus]RMA79993.1 tRNA pseudouridine32 synthase/23S rRNA pseudouridine746 synthase [Umboniibacter marinipuniceus]
MAAAQHSQLDILFQTEHFIAVNKPADLLSVPGRGVEKIDSVVHRARAQFGFAEAVHRLDMPTSGIMLVALTKDADKALKRQFSERTTRKRYEAMIWGLPEQESGVIDQPLICDWDNRPRQIVCYEHGKASQTQWKITEKLADRCRVSLVPITGRSHQLRVHLQWLGHPILGDEFYAEGHAKLASDRLLLHAAELDFDDPVTGQRHRLSSAVPF